jgi:ABC-2 type transport system permease protein
VSTTLTHSWYMTRRHMRNLSRQPWWIAITLVQPIVWLLLYGALFRKIVEIPGFRAGAYIDFLTPGIVVMTAFFAAGWSGMGVIDDLNRGVVDRFLVTPVSRTALIAGRLIQGAAVAVIQSAIIIALGFLLGGHFPGGAAGLAALVVCAVLLGTGVGALSTALALLLRKEESVIAASNFVLLPLTFLSAVFMQEDLTPPWIQHVARFNPVNWAVQAGREALQANPDWGLVFFRMGYLLAFMLVCGWLATRAFRAYQRSV